MTRAAQAADTVARLEPTPVFDSYWWFAAERQRILFRRLLGQSPQWTDDPILRTYKFTNSYRVADRVSQYLVGKVLRGPGADGDPRNTLFRLLLFKLFNRIETWELLRAAVGEPHWQRFDAREYGQVLARAMEQGQRIYSAAYIIPPVRAFGVGGPKHVGHLALIDNMVGGSLPKDIQQSKDLEALYQLIASYPSMGPFLGFQLAIDLAYSDLVPHDESQFVVAGPGALDGIAKCFAAAGRVSPAEIIRLVHESQEVEFERRGINFPSLFGRPLQLIDCQNLFCEISKFARVAHPDIKGLSGRTRIKQTFAPQAALPPLEMPARWGLDPTKLPRAAALT